MSDSPEWVVQWLRDAHAMEEQAETMLSALLGRLDNYPERPYQSPLGRDDRASGQVGQLPG
jgi:hypothetical protein